MRTASCPASLAGPITVRSTHRRAHYRTYQATRELRTMAHTLGLTVYQPDKTDHGYTLFAPMTGTGAYLIDMQGRVMHHWSLPHRPGAYGYLLDNGHLLMAGRTGKSPAPFGGAGGTLMELDWDGNVQWEYVEDTMHHAFCRLPNGNTMVLGWDPV